MMRSESKKMQAVIEDQKNYSSDEIMVAPAAVIPHQDNDFQYDQWVDLIVGLGTVIANPTSEVLAKI